MSWQRLQDLLYITRARALELGATHEGTLFGVSAWFFGDDEDAPVCGPKVPALVLWTLFADAAYETATFFLPADQFIEAPIRITRRIPGQVGP